MMFPQKVIEQVSPPPAAIKVYDIPESSLLEGASKVARVSLAAKSEDIVGLIELEVLLDAKFRVLHITSSYGHDISKVEQRITQIIEEELKAQTA